MKEINISEIQSLERQHNENAEYSGAIIRLYNGLRIGIDPFLLNKRDYQIVENRISDYKRSAQQVDSAEASTIAVPPSDPSGSPR